MGKIYQVVVYGVSGEKMVIDLCDTEEQMQRMTVKQLKEKIVERLPKFADHLDVIRLIFTDKILEGDSTLLSEYGIEHKSVIQMVIRIPGGGSISGTGDGGMGDKGGKNRSMEILYFF